MAIENIDLKDVETISLVGQTYMFKFLRSPLVDRCRYAFLGRRRGAIPRRSCSLLAAVRR